MKWLKRRRTWVIGIFALVLLSGVIWYQKNTLADQPKITVSKQTTFITEPLKADGLPDYEKALDERYRKGITPENNAAIPFWQAFGPKSIPKPLREELFNRLGIEDLPEDGEYFVALSEFAENPSEYGVPISKDAFYDQDLYAADKPWTKAELPAVAHWIEINEKPLERILQASRRKRFYSPFLELRASGSIVVDDSTDLALFRAERETYRILLRRAMMRFGEGEIRAAKDDLLACHRLTRLYSQYETNMSLLVAIAGTASACEGDKILMDSGKLSLRELLAYERQLRSLGPLPGFADSTNDFERLSTLDSIIRFARIGTAEDEGIEATALVDDPSEDLKRVWNRRQRFIRLKMLDWNTVLQSVNDKFDEAVKVYQEPEYQVRLKQIRRLEEETERLQDQTLELEDYAGDWWISEADRQGATNWFTQKLMRDTAERVRHMTQAEGRSRMRYKIELLALSLCAYRAENGEFPESLNSLIPRYVQKIPMDFFSGKPLSYRRENLGFVLYSVGQNGEDDGARGYEGGTSYDDVVIQIPLPKPNRSMN